MWWHACVILQKLSYQMKLWGTKSQRVLRFLLNQGIIIQVTKWPAVIMWMKYSFMAPKKYLWLLNFLNCLVRCRWKVVFVNNLSWFPKQCCLGWWSIRHWCLCGLTAVVVCFILHWTECWSTCISALPYHCNRFCLTLLTQVVTIKTILICRRKHQWM